MTGYVNNRLSKGNLRLFMNRAYLIQYNGLPSDATDTLCKCIVDESKNKPGIDITYLDETANERTSRLIRTSIGGRVVFGNNNTPIKLNYMGGWEGQPGGTQRPLRNKF
jgi:hypothetical protein